MIKNIVDKDGNVIGQLELKDDAVDSDWQFQLQSYKYDPPTPPKIIPNVTPRQMRQALTLFGITEQQINDAIATLPEDIQPLAMIEWQYSTLFERRRPLVLKVQEVLGWTDQQVDDLWNLAASL